MRPRALGTLVSTSGGTMAVGLDNGAPDTPKASAQAGTTAGHPAVDGDIAVINMSVVSVESLASHGIGGSKRYVMNRGRDVGKSPDGQDAPVSTASGSCDFVQVEVVPRPCRVDAGRHGTVHEADTNAPAWLQSAS